jgi:hypothetical protein
MSYYEANKVVGNYVGRRVQIDSPYGRYGKTEGVVERESYQKVFVRVEVYGGRSFGTWYKKEYVKLLDEETEETMKPFSDNEKKVYLVYYDLDPNPDTDMGYDIERLVTTEAETVYYMTKREFEIEMAAENLDTEHTHFVFVDNKLYQMKNVLELKEV